MIIGRVIDQIRKKAHHSWLGIKIYLLTVNPHGETSQTDKIQEYLLEHHSFLEHVRSGNMYMIYILSEKKGDL